MSGLPSSWCRTLARFDFMRVPKPAARIKTSTGLFGLLVEGDDIRIQFVRHLSGGKFMRTVSSRTIDDCASEAFRVMTDHFFFVQEVCSEDLDSSIARFCFSSSFKQYLQSAISRVNLGLLGTDRSVMIDGVIEVNLRSLTANGV